MKQPAERDVYYSRMETELHAARTSQWAFPGAERFHPEFAMHLRSSPKGSGFSLCG